MKSKTRRKKTAGARERDAGRIGIRRTTALSCILIIFELVGGDGMDRRGAQAGVEEEQPG